MPPLFVFSNFIVVKSLSDAAEKIMDNISDIAIRKYGEAKCFSEFCRDAEINSIALEFDCLRTIIFLTS